MSAADSVILTSFVCVYCDRPVTMEVPVEGFLRWQAGELIQNALPSVVPTEREMLITRMCEPCIVAMEVGGE